MGVYPLTEFRKDHNVKQDVTDLIGFGMLSCAKPWPALALAHALSAPRVCVRSRDTNATSLITRSDAIGRVFGVTSPTATMHKNLNDLNGFVVKMLDKLKLKTSQMSPDKDSTLVSCLLLLQNIATVTRNQI